MRFLVIGPSWIGDLVMSQCLYKTIKQNYPQSTIDIMAPAWCAQVINRMPEINECILMPIKHGEFNLKARYQIGKQLRKNNYDACYVLPNSWKSALIPLFASIPKRYGWIGEQRYFLLNNYRKNKIDFPRLIERYCALFYDSKEVKTNKDLPQIPQPSLLHFLENKDSIFSKFAIKKCKYIIGLCPGAEFGITKKWPTEYYATLSSFFINKYKDCLILILGSEKDKQTAEEIFSFMDDKVKLNTVILAGKTSIEEAIDVLSYCHIVISNDSGLMHVTAAVGTKLVAIFGSTSTKYTPPSTEKALLIESNAECHPCFKKQCKFNNIKCLKDIYPKYVWDKIESTWNSL